MEVKNIDEIILGLKKVVDVFYIEKVKLMYINNEEITDENELQYIVEVGNDMFNDKKFVIFIDSKKLSYVIRYEPIGGNVYEWEFKQVTEVIKKIKKYLDKKLGNIKNNI